jgi:AAA domain
MTPHSSPRPPSDAQPFPLQALGPSDVNAGDINWLWRGYLAAGQITLLTSLWKSGKTTLLSFLLARLQDGTDLLGLSVRPARSLVLSEEGADLWHGRRQRLDFGNQASLISRPFAGKATDAQWQALIDYSASVLGNQGARLLVVDTVASLMPGGVETNADCMVRALAPLRRLADQGIAVWLMHHPHKGKTRLGQLSRGTGALPGAADIVLEMHRFRPDDPADRRRVLLGHSRHEETPRRLLFERTPDATAYRILADEPDDDFQRAWSTLSLVLSTTPGPQTASEILRAWPPDSPPPSRATLHRWLARAVQSQLLCYEAGNRRNAPYRYWLSDPEEA